MNLVGTWFLTSYEVHFADGREPVSPFGDEPFGQLIYASDLHMSAVICRADRKRSDGKLERASAISDAEKIDAFDSYMSYGGRYEVVADEVHHHVTHSLFENSVGETFVRAFAFDGERLELTYDVEAKSGVTRHFKLAWRRA